VVKVLDFGLAAMAQSTPGISDPANSPTLTIRATPAGMIMGTPRHPIGRNRPPARLPSAGDGRPARVAPKTMNIPIATTLIMENQYSKRPNAPTLRAFT
jgi:hypothetical protein